MADEEAYYALLERHFLSYADLAEIPVSDNGEAFVPLGAEFHPRTNDDTPIRELVRMQQLYTGPEIYVREAVPAMLALAQRELAAIFEGCRLEVSFGYRHPEVQETAYERVKRTVVEAHPMLSPVEIDEAVHRFVAVPSVAGHPTGGAVDVLVRLADGTALDMGTAIGALVSDSYVHSPFIGKAAHHHRQLLRGAMIKAGFAPFDGEWWHFSYGDREWAKYYNRPAALYTQVRFEI